MWLLVFALIFCFGYALGYSCTILTEEAPATQSGTTTQEDHSETAIDEYQDGDEHVKRRFYLAGCYKDRETLVPCIDSLSAIGYECTFNWAACEPPSKDNDTMIDFASKSIEGVVSADVLVAVLNDKDYAYHDTFTEIGCALGLGIPVIVYCPYPHDQVYVQTNCFFRHPAIRHVSAWDEATQAIEEILD